MSLHTYGFPATSLYHPHPYSSSEVKVNMLVIQCAWLLVAPWTVAHQLPLSVGFSRQEYWNGLPFSSPGNLPDIYYLLNIHCISVYSHTFLFEPSPVPGFFHPSEWHKHIFNSQTSNLSYFWFLIKLYKFYLWIYWVQFIFPHLCHYSSSPYHHCFSLVTL